MRRAERRGKELPTILKTALEQQIERWEKYGTPLPVFDVSVVGVEGIDIYNATTTGKVSKTLTSAATDIDHTHVVCYDARGNGDGKIAPTITGDHNNRITDYTSLVCETYAENSSGNGIAGTIACNNDQTLFQQTETCYIVRRHTPLECCRLQGFPDDWAKDIPHSDAQEYRMWGNGMALPNALYIMEGIADAFAKEGMG